MGYQRTIVISDIHGCCDEFRLLLTTAAYEPDRDRLILLGDYVDRGPKSRDVMDEVYRLRRDHGAVVLLGNHDQRFLEVATSPDSPLVERFFAHGGIETLASYWEAVYPGQPFERGRFQDACARIRSEYGHHLSLLREALLYAEDDQHVYVHAGLHPDYPDWRNQPEHLFYTVREPFLNQPPSIGRIVVFGHTQVMNLHGSADVWFGDGAIGIDGGCSAGRQLNALVIEEGKPYTTYAVRAQQPA